MKFFAQCLAAMLLSPVAAISQSFPAEFNVLQGWKTDRGSYIAAFEFRLEQGWKTYWRSPGDAGIPPSLDLKKSKNLDSFILHWPKPTVYEEGGTRTVGYADRFVLPIEIFPKNGAKETKLSGSINIGVCQDICVPIGFRFSSPLWQDGQDRADIKAALDLVPPRTEGLNIQGLGCQVDPISDGMQITAQVPARNVPDPMAVIIEHRNPEVWVSSVEVESSGHSLTMMADLVPADAAPFALDRRDITVTVIGKDAALEIEGCPAPGS